MQFHFTTGNELVNKQKPINSITIVTGNEFTG